MAMSLTSCWKSGVCATKSVSQFTSTSTPILPPAWIYDATTPSRASRCAFLAASANPFFLRYSRAPCRSPCVASRAALQSIIPAPVRSRRSFTISADDAMIAILPDGALSGSAASRRRHLRLGHDRLFGGRFLCFLLGERSRSFEDGVGHARGDESHGADGIIVAGDGIVDSGGVAVGVDDGDDWDGEALRLFHRDLFLLGIDDENSGGQPIHVLDADERALELGALPLEADDFLLGQPLVFPRLVHLVQLLEAPDGLPNGREVGEGSPEPAMVHVEHATAAGLLEHRFL